MATGTYLESKRRHEHPSTDTGIDSVLYLEYLLAQTQRQGSAVCAASFGARPLGRPTQRTVMGDITARSNNTIMSR